MSIDELRLLVVEDHGFQRWSMMNMLAALGAKQVFVAADGRAALEAYHNTHPPLDLIITDLDMPGMDGMELIRHLGMARSRASIILVSSHDRSVMAAAEAAGRAHGVDIIGTIEKPATSQELKAAIELHRKCRASLAVCDVNLSAADVVRGLRCNEFEAFFQPRVHVQTREVRGGRAIGVWRHPTYGPLLPGRFMPVVKACGLQGEVDRCIVESSVTQCREWRRASIDQPVSIAVTARSLSDLRFADSIHDAVNAHSLDVHHVTVEVDELPEEGALAVAIENIARLRMKGFPVALPYGSRYCVLQHFRALPCTELRIDQGFVRQAWANGSEPASLVATLEAARAASMATSVHGIDTVSDWDLLGPLAVDFALGAWLGTPCPARDFTLKARSETCRVVNG